jgi:hypothetical protein
MQEFFGDVHRLPPSEPTRRAGSYSNYIHFKSLGGLLQARPYSPKWFVSPQAAKLADFGETSSPKRSRFAGSIFGLRTECAQSSPALYVPQGT